MIEYIEIEKFFLRVLSNINIDLIIKDTLLIYKKNYCLLIKNPKTKYC